MRDCQHARADHRHGTRVAYVFDRCRCPGCRAANTAAARKRTTAIAYGRWPGLVDADPARGHLAELRDAGLSLHAITRLSGVSQGTVRALLHTQAAGPGGTLLRLRADTERRLLAVRPDPAGLSAHWGGATGSTHRLQSLAALGWTVPALTAHIDRSDRTLRRALRGGAVTADTATAVADLYDRMHMTRPPDGTPAQHATSTRTAAHARAAGWRPPLAHPDLDTDTGTPEPTPTTDAAHSGDGAPLPAPAGGAVGPTDRCAGPALDEIAVERAMTGEQLPLTAAERRQAVTRLTSRGLSARSIAELLHTTSRTVTRLRRSPWDTAA